ncbi:MAG: DUF6796 family protein [Bacteroidota bacterium]
MTDPFPTPPYAWIRTAGIVAALGAFIAAVGDYLLLYSPDGGYLVGDYQFLAEIPNSRLLWGHYLGILGIPFQVAGVYLFYLGLKPLGPRISYPTLFLGVLVIFPGVVYHGGIYPLAEAVRTGPEWVELFRPFNEPLALGFVSVFFILIICLNVLILRGGTRFPKWLVLLSPIVTYAFWMLLYFVVPAVGNVLAPMGFNLSMGIFFVAILASGCLKDEA